MKSFLLLLLLVLCVLNASFAQQANAGDLSVELDDLAKSQIPNLNKEVDVSVNDLPLKELVRVIANNTGLNIVVDNNANWKINNNFNKVLAKDVILYLCSEFNLEFSNQGSIIQLKIPPQNGEKMLIKYDSSKGTIMLDVKNTTIKNVLREITLQSDINFTYAPNLSNKSITCFYKDLAVGEAITRLCSENGLQARTEGNQLYVIEEYIAPTEKEIADSKKSKRNNDLYLREDHGLFTVKANDEPVENIFEAIAANSICQFSFLSAYDAKTTLNLENAELEDILNIIFKGSEFTYKKQNELYFIGKRNNQALKSCDVYKFNNRRADSISVIIPDQYTKDLEIIEMLELNSLIIWGDADKLSDFKIFLKQIDKTIPVVLMDVIIVDVSKTYDLETGFEAGLSSEPKNTIGLINPGLDFTLSSGSINNIFNSVGLTNLGRVTPEFYIKLKAMESDGIIDIRSTPQLATLNGYSAVLSIGRTEYYKEELSNIWGTQNPQLQTQSQYKPVEANLQIVLRPFVTGNGQVSIDVEYDQAEFTERISEYAPPGIVSRSFKSKIRVKNQDMILLGGLEEDEDVSNRSGWPLLSRIPVLKWIFTSNNEKYSKKHLNIFIRPTVIY